MWNMAGNLNVITISTTQNCRQVTHLLRHTQLVSSFCNLHCDTDLEREEAESPKDDRLDALNIFSIWLKGNQYVFLMQWHYRSLPEETQRNNLSFTSTLENTRSETICSMLKCVKRNEMWRRCLVKCYKIQFYTLCMLWANSGNVLASQYHTEIASQLKKTAASSLLYFSQPHTSHQTQNHAM